MALSNNLILASVGVVIMMSLWEPVSSHMRLWTPPARGTMWRRGYDTPINYDDNQMFCGGFAHQVELGYKCGVCGDPYDAPTPRPNEAGGEFATGIITAEYTQGQEVTLQVEITANHKGYFEFKICPTDDYTETATQECFDQNVLQLADGSGTRLDVTQYHNSMADVAVTLPADLTCEFCTLQLRYHAGNSWGSDSDNPGGCIGCGFQEEFYGCADIKISPSNGSQIPTSFNSSPSVPSSSNSPGSSTGSPASTSSSVPPSTSTTAPGATSTPTTTTSSTTTESNTVPPSSVPTFFNCTGTPDTSAMATWCNNNCNWIPPNCPASMCHCQLIAEPRFSVVSAPGCYAKTPFYAATPSWDAWCGNNCALLNCPANICFCKT